MEKRDILKPSNLSLSHITSFFHITESLLTLEINGHKYEKSEERYPMDIIHVGLFSLVDLIRFDKF